MFVQRPKFPALLSLLIVGAAQILPTVTFSNATIKAAQFSELYGNRPQVLAAFELPGVRCAVSVYEALPVTPIKRARRWAGTSFPQRS